MLNVLHYFQQQIALTSLKIKRDGKKQRLNILKLRVRIKVFFRHTVKLSIYEIILGLII